MRGARWQVASAEVPPELAGHYPVLMARIMAGRGIKTLEAAELFLAGDARLSNDWRLLPDIRPAMARIYRAILSGERIAVYGDFDTDGITATALMVTGLRSLGAEAIPYIPHRLTEGYGLKTDALKKLAEEGVSLVVSVDCGITAVTEVKEAKRFGLDVIITDHHLPLETLPPAVAMIDPRRVDSVYPFQDLAGVGVAFKVVEALFAGMGRPLPKEHFLELAAIGTVADIMPLTGENRYLVKEGLKHLNDHPSPGLLEIINMARLRAGQLDAESISWQVAPRLNAAGRLEHAIMGYDLLMAATPDKAKDLALILEDRNLERQRLTAKFVARAREQVLSGPLDPLLLVEDAECPPGILGLVAGRLSDEFYRPSIVIRREDGMATASCRSIPGFNITQAIDQCGHLLCHYGGHAQAAGFSLKTEDLPKLSSLISEIAAKEIASIDLQPVLTIDTEARFHEIGGNLFQILNRLGPFGEANRPPLFVSRCVTVLDHRTMGNAQEHIKMRLTQGGSVWEAVAFRQAEEMKKLLPGPIDVVYNLELDKFNGRETLRLNIVDFAAAS
ncbi:single-stranded-DNA-specific exonuclease RecJ [Dehalogenimonas etheniformans]|uniref:Single-stranded-DNA-specific exonuclease RecJ n=1 Tax=Dehalogenimonas etheniformans TaxID=1536648 RepID=A0A2P5P903_9CHLR|nr:single-stranded-DNA-specific exonuclease RecJ [Dehalogenimonas etheniformans]PPD58777.1 single-stranded-DNA-specific exonuclease RecJ [Dehalogenimonas etheniformans]QNT76452.1 single-stranded-DNA-specific exonuclease RecJ [Dehalogenimonas etheniformans]